MLLAISGNQSCSLIQCRFFAVILFLSLLVLYAVPAMGEQQESNSGAGAAIAQGMAPYGYLSDTSPRNTLDRVRRSGVLRVGVSHFVPWVMVDKKGGLVGFEIDVARQLADDLGVEVLLVEASWPHIIDDLLENRFDIIISRMLISPLRALSVNFSIPYFHSSTTLVANRAKAGEMRDVAAYNSADVTLAFRTGTLAENVIKKTFPKAKLQAFDSEETMLNGLLNGEVQAVVSLSPAPEIWVAQFPGKLFLPLSEPLIRRAEALAVRKGDHDLLSFLNTWIRYYEENGWLPERRNYWFHSLAWKDQLE
jgi:polar amino acid transport system substrate-binding protein